MFDGGNFDRGAVNLGGKSKKLSKADFLKKNKADRERRHELMRRTEAATKIQKFIMY